MGMYSRLVRISLLAILTVLLVLPTMSFAQPDDTLIVNVSASVEGEGTAYAFPYLLVAGTVLEWDLNSDNSERNFDFLIFDDPDIPIGSIVFEVNDTTASQDSVELPRAGLWVLVVRHSRFSGNYDLHVTGWISQTGTTPPETTTLPTTTEPPSLTTTPPPQPSPPGGDDRSWIWPAIIVGFVALIAISAYAFMKYGRD